jgi:type IV pilus assembly protein PilP
MRTQVLILGAGVLWALTGCEEEPLLPADLTATAAPGAAPKAAPTAGRSRRGRVVGDGEERADDADAPPKVEFQEEDFVETERSRDPFRSFEDLFLAKADNTMKAQRKVILADVALDELKLIGIVSRINPAKAMLVDPRGDGHVVHRGDFVGKAERVQGATPDADYEINWRVERIRDSDMVLVREDPRNPDVPTATRVIALRPEEEK